MARKVDSEGIVKIAPSEPGPAELKFKRGDEVILNSGGSVMTVRRTEGEMVYVDWHTDDGHWSEADYYYDMLLPFQEELQVIPKAG